MKNPSISIIVAVFNLEYYLEQCLDSIRSQTFADFECIVVDDGSSDATPEICDRYAGMDSRFKVIHQENGGLSHALNSGLAVAAGDYIGFVDADDWIEPTMFELLFRLATEHGAEMSQCGFIKEYRGHSDRKRIVRRRLVMGGRQAMHAIACGNFPSYKWIRLHKRSIITCPFPDFHNFEDIYVYGEWLKNVRKLVADPSPLYHYRMRKGSIVNSDYAKNRYDYFLSCLHAMKSVADGTGSVVSDEERNAFIHKAAVRACKLIARNERDKGKRMCAIEKIRDIASRYEISSASLMGRKNHRRAELLQESPERFVILLRLLRVVEISSLFGKSMYFN